MKIKKITTGLVVCLAAVMLLNSCQSYHKRKVINDCSAAFKTRYVDNNKIASASKVKGKNVTAPQEVEVVETTEDKSSQLPTECKILELKLDSSTTCEIVGSDKIDNVSQALNDNRDKKIILITPTEKFRDLGNAAQKYLSSNGIEAQKYFDSELFKNLDFPYKGMRCVKSGKAFEVWMGEKQVLISLAGF